MKTRTEEDLLGVEGITANEETCRRYVMDSIGLITFLTHHAKRSIAANISKTI